MNAKTMRTGAHRNNEPLELTFLSPSHIRIIEEALSAVGESGEVRLIVENGRLRLIVAQKSFVISKREI